MLQIISQSILVFALVAPVFGADVDFDRGVDLTDFIGSAVRQAPVSPLLPAVDIPAAKPDAGKICNINFKAQPLELRAGDKSAQASYRINERCEPELVSVKYSQDVPAPKTPEAGNPLVQQPKTFAGLVRADSPGADGTRSIKDPTIIERKVLVSHNGNNGFHFLVSNYTIWVIDTFPPRIIEFYTIPNALATAPWKVVGEPIPDKDWVDEPNKAYTHAQASFTCGPGCKFDTQLAAHANIFSDGKLVPEATVVGNMQQGDNITIDVITP